MKLLIPPSHAIQILQARLADIDKYNFNPRAWKDRTANDLREIFPVGSMQWLQISHINFDTFITSEKAKVLAEGKDTARQLISSYIDFIDQYSKIAQQKQVGKEKDYEQKYRELLKDWNELVPGYNALIKKYDEQLASSDALIRIIDLKDTEIERIKAEAIHLDSVSFSKLFNAFSNLPVWQIASTMSVLVAIIVGTFSLGSTYQRNEDNKQMLDHKTEINRLQNENEVSNETVLKKKAEIYRLKSSIDSLTLELKLEKAKPKK